MVPSSSIFVGENTGSRSQSTDHTNGNQILSHGHGSNGTKKTNGASALDTTHGSNGTNGVNGANGSSSTNGSAPSNGASGISYINGANGNNLNGHASVTNHHKKTWITLLCDDFYLAGALVLNYSLQKVESKYPLLVLYTSAVSLKSIKALRQRNIATRLVDRITAPRQTGVVHPRFDDTFTKTQGFRLIEYETVGYIDADAVFLQNADELLEIAVPAATVAACHSCTCNPAKNDVFPKNWTPENCAYTSQSLPAALTSGQPCTFRLGSLNSGVMIFHPSLSIVNHANQILHNAPEHSLPFSDQSLYNIIFEGTWVPLPYTYNALKTLRTCHGSIFQLDQVKILHFLLSKPWKDPDDPEPLHRVWWDLERERKSEEAKMDLLAFD